MNQADVPALPQRHRDLVNLARHAAAAQAHAGGRREKRLLAICDRGQPPRVPLHGGMGLRAGRAGDTLHAPGVHRSQRPCVGDQVGLGALPLAGQQRIGQRGALAEVFHEQDARRGIGAQQAGGDGHGHAAEQFKGGELGLEAPVTGVVVLLVAAALQHHRAAVSKPQPKDMVPVPDPLRGLDLGPFAPGAGQHGLGGLLLASGQHGARCGVGHGPILTDRATEYRRRHRPHGWLTTGGLSGWPDKQANRERDRSGVILAIGAVLIAGALVTGAAYLLMRGISGKSADKKARRRGRAGPAGGLDAAPPPVRVVGTAPPSQEGLGKLPTIRRPPGADTGKSGKAARRRTQLPPDSVVTFAAERKAAAIDDVFAALDRELIGLVPVKKQVEEIGSLLLVDRGRQRVGVVAPRPNLHMCFTGAPGTGKTTVGLLMADLLHQLGYLEQGQLVHVMRDDLVGEYVGQTAPKTRRVLERAMGGVLFIDEASALYQPDNSRDFGLESIEILLQVMENQRDKFIVVLAGYKDRMDTFFESNPGMRSRVAHHLDFADYSVDELVAIGRLMLERASYYLSDDAVLAFRRYLTVRMQQPQFANARSVRNELERARLRHAHRLVAEGHRRLGRDDLKRIGAENIFVTDASPAPAIS